MVVFNFIEYCNFRILLWCNDFYGIDFFMINGIGLWYKYGIMVIVGIFYSNI